MNVAMNFARKHALGVIAYARGSAYSRKHARAHMVNEVSLRNAP